MGADELTDWARGDSLTATHLQQPVSVLRKMLGKPNSQVGQLRIERGGFTFVVTIGKIVTSGPEGEADFTNEQYWVKPQYIEEGAQDAAITLTDITPPDEYTDDDTADPAANIKPVTNLAELKDGTHKLKEGQFVWFFAISDGADDPADHLLMSEGTGGSVDVLNNGTNVVSATPFINLPSGTSGVLEFAAATVSGTAGANLEFHGASTRQVLQFNGSVYLWDYVRFH